MKKLFALCVCAVVFALSVFARDVTVTVVDADLGIPLEGAKIRLSGDSFFPLLPVPYLFVNLISSMFFLSCPYLYYRIFYEIFSILGRNPRRNV